MSASILNKLLLAKARLSELRHFKRVVSKLEDHQISSKTIVFHTIRDYPLVQDMELFLALLLSKLGAQTLIILDDGVMKHWDTMRISTGGRSVSNGSSGALAKPFSYDRKVWRLFWKNYYRHPNMKFVDYSQIIKWIDGTKKTNELSYLAGMLERHALSSTRRYFESPVDLSRERHASYFHLSMHNAQASLAAGRYIEQIIKPDLFITSHGIYSLWGPCYDYLAHSMGKANTWVYGLHAYRSQSVLLSHDKIQIAGPDKQVMEEISINWNADLETTAKNFMDKRIGKTSRDTSVYYEGQMEPIRLAFQNHYPVIGIFPNVIWDGDIEERNILFNGVVEWIIKTIEFSTEHAMNIVVRFHPAEDSLFGETTKLENIIRARLPNVDSLTNVRLISSSRKIDSYELISKFLDIVLVYDGILALEAPYLGKPVIICANSRYRSCGFTYDPTTQNEYFEYLSNIGQLTSHFEKCYPKTRENVLKSAYWWFVKAGHYLPTIADDLDARSDLKGISVNDVNYEKSNELRRILETLLGMEL